MTELALDDRPAVGDLAGLLAERVLLFGIGGECFAVPAGCVREILEVPPITRVPGAVPFASGLINVRGEVVPLADLRIPFGMPLAASDADTRVIVIETSQRDGERELIGILADRVSDVGLLDDHAIDPPPGYGMRWRPELVAGIGRKAGAFVIIPNLAAILEESVVGAPLVTPTRNPAI